MYCMVTSLDKYRIKSRLSHSIVPLGLLNFPYLEGRDGSIGPMQRPLSHCYAPKLGRARVYVARLFESTRFRSLVQRFLDLLFAELIVDWPPCISIPSAYWMP